MKTLMTTLALLVAVMGLTLAPVHAASQLETSISVQNETQNADGTKVKAKPGDILTYTMSLKNLGPDDLVDYIPQVNVEDILPFGEITNYGDGGVFEDNIFISYPPVLQSATCDCEDTFSFTVKLDENICVENRVPDRAFPIVVFEDSGVGINIECAPAPTPVQPTTVPKSGPEVYAMLLLAFVGVVGTRFAWNRN